jgi:homoserine O-acetyltransferase
MLRLMIATLFAFAALPVAAQRWQPVQGDLTVHDFRFGSGETLDVRLHYRTLGTPHRNAAGEIDNAVMLLHGTGGSGARFLDPTYADALFAPGAPLDIARYYLILPDNLGHGGSSKPSDGLRMKFPRYDYDDMVELQHRLLVDGLGVHRLELLLGTSMGCMHAFVWGERFPGFARRLAPFGCNTVAIAGRNRMQRRLAIEAIEADPAWDNGNYTSPPLMGMRAAASLSLISGLNALGAQAQYPTRAASDAAVDTAMARLMQFDANDSIYATDASRNYDASGALEKITVPLLWVNSGDDFVNPPELGLAQKQVGRMPRAHFVLIPGSTETHGHTTFLYPQFWKADLARLMATPASP